MSSQATLLMVCIECKRMVDLRASGGDPLARWAIRWVHAQNHTPMFIGNVCPDCKRESR